MTEPVRPDDTDEFEPTDSEVVEEAADEPQAADDAEFDAAERQEVEDATPPSKPAASRERAGRTIAAAPVVDELPYVDDRVSKVWVGLIALVFVAIFAWGLLFGQRGGLLTPTEPPPPTASPAPSLTASPIPSRTPAPSGTPGASGSPAASPSGAPTSSPLSSPSPVASPSPGVTGTPVAGPT